MADKQKDKAQETEVTVAQFKRSLDHILIGEKNGPVIDIGPYSLKFKEKGNVLAIAALLADDNKVDAMKNYIRGNLVDDPAVHAAYEEVLGKIDVEGLGEILNVLSEAYTSFQDQS